MQTLIDFEEFVTKLELRLTHPLPGASAHEPMRAVPLGPRRPTFSHSVPPKPGSVLILLYPENNQIRFPLTLRADYAGAHGGQISLPGGKEEPGENTIDTALRECEEEIGVKRNQIKVIGKLSNFFVIPSNFLVTPVVGVSKIKPSFIADPVEVVRILECDLSGLIDNDAIKQKEIIAAKKFRMLAPHFEMQGEIIWGATAMMLNEFRTIVREVMGMSDE